METPLVGIVMGSESDAPIMQEAAEVCREFGVPYEMRILSAHRTPWDMAWYGKTAHRRGLKVLIAGAGGAAHLPGMLASFSPLPVIGVPIPSRYLQGQDSLLSIVQMPTGIPVATVAIGAGRNAGLLAIQILAISQPELLEKVLSYRARLAQTVREANRTNPIFTPIVLPTEWSDRPPWEETQQ